MDQSGPRASPGFVPIRRLQPCRNKEYRPRHVGQLNRSFLAPTLAPISRFTARRLNCGPGGECVSSVFARNGDEFVGSVCRTSCPAGRNLKSGNRVIADENAAAGLGGRPARVSVQQIKQRQICQPSEFDQARIRDLSTSQSECFDLRSASRELNFRRISACFARRDRERPGKIVASCSAQATVQPARRIARKKLRRESST